MDRNRGRGEWLRGSGSTRDVFEIRTYASSFRRSRVKTSYGVTFENNERGELHSKHERPETEIHRERATGHKRSDEYNAGGRGRIQYHVDAGSGRRAG